MGPHGRPGRGALISLQSGRFPMSQGGDGHLEGDGLMTVLILLLVTFRYRREMDAQCPREGGARGEEGVLVLVNAWMHKKLMHECTEYD